MNRIYYRYFSCIRTIYIFLLFFLLSAISIKSEEDGLKIGKQGYFEMQGLNVLVFNNSYSEGHQGGIEIIQHGVRVATNGNLRLSQSPGQWQPVPQLGDGFEKIGCSPQDIGFLSRIVDTLNNEIWLPCSYPDTSRSRQGFNPIIYPDLELNYEVHVKTEGKSFIITVDLEKPLPEEWVGKVGYNIELFPGDLYGKTFFMNDSSGIFPRQANGPTYFNDDNETEAVPLAKGNNLIVAPENDLMRMEIESSGSELQLLDGSLKHNNGWFVVRSLIPSGATKGAIIWKISPNVIPNWINDPVVHISQVGYHPNQNKVAYIELDKHDNEVKKASLLKLDKNGDYKTIKEIDPVLWGQYLRYKYFNFDFSEVTEHGMYTVKYGDFRTNPFIINSNVYKRHVWQPTLEYFIPIQMCHMRVNQKYRVWHGECHIDDALMAPLNINHFDGYDNTNETSTLSPFKPLEHIPGMNVGGWHDAGDYDLRIESQAWTVIVLAHAYEEFNIEYDETFIDQKHKHVELLHPDGKPDLLQQVEHGVLNILAGYNQLGKLYRGIIVPTLRQYVHLGDAATQTDNKIFNDEETKEKINKIEELWYKKVSNRYSNIFDPEMNLNQIEVYAPELDDRLLFMETNPARQLLGSASLAIASRVLKDYNPKLSQECLTVAEELWETNSKANGERVDAQKIQTLTELIITTDKAEYKNALCSMSEEVKNNFAFVGWSAGRALKYLDCPEFNNILTEAATAYKPILDQVMNKTPFGSPLENTERIGFTQYFLNKAWPEIFGEDHLFAVVNYILGCRPGNTTNSLVSGVGVSSPTIAYGTNRADWSYIPGGTFWNAVNLVSPDFAEDKIWPFMWQEREYIITAPCFYMFNILAVDNALEGK